MLMVNGLRKAHASARTRNARKPAPHTQQERGLLVIRLVAATECRVHLWDACAWLIRSSGVEATCDSEVRLIDPGMRKERVYRKP